MKRRKRKEPQRRGRTTQSYVEERGEERKEMKGKQVRRMTQVTVFHMTSEEVQGLQDTSKKTVSQSLFPDIFKGKGTAGGPQTNYTERHTVTFLKLQNNNLLSAQEVLRTQLVALFLPISIVGLFHVFMSLPNPCTSLPFSVSADDLVPLLTVKNHK